MPVDSVATAASRAVTMATDSSPSRNTGAAVPPAAQAVAAVGAGRGVDVVAESAQALDVAAHRPRRHAEVPGQLGTRPVGPAGEAGEQRERPSGRVVGRVRHGCKSLARRGQILSATLRTVAVMTTTDAPTSLAWDDLVATVTAAGGGVFLATAGADGRPHVAWVMPGLGRRADVAGDVRQLAEGGQPPPRRAMWR